jgi:hypothetical protein
MARLRVIERPLRALARAVRYLASRVLCFISPQLFLRPNSRIWRPCGLLGLSLEHRFLLDSIKGFRAQTLQLHLLFIWGVHEGDFKDRRWRTFKSQ